MNEEKIRFLPEIKIDPNAENKLLLNFKSGFTIELKVIGLHDRHGHEIKTFKEVNEKTKVRLLVKIRNASVEEPEPDNYLIYQFGGEGWQKDSSGRITSIPTGVSFKQLISEVNSDFVSKNFTKTNTKRGGKGRPAEGLDKTDMEYEIRVNYAPGSNIAVYLFELNSSNSNYKPIAGNNVETNLIWNRVVKVDPQIDCLNIIPVTNNEELISKEWKIVIGIVSLVLILLFSFASWKIWKKRKARRKLEEDQLKVF